MDQRREALRVVREFGRTLSPRETAGALVFGGGVATGVLQLIFADAIYGEGVFPMLMLGEAASVMAAGVGAVIYGLSSNQYSRMSKNSLLTTEAEFTNFMRLPEDEQLRRMDENPDLAEFITRLAEQVSRDRVPSRAI